MTTLRIAPQEGNCEVHQNGNKFFLTLLLAFLGQFLLLVVWVLIVPDEFPRISLLSKCSECHGSFSGPFVVRSLPKHLETIILGWASVLATNQNMAKFSLWTNVQEDFSCLQDADASSNSKFVTVFTVVQTTEVLFIHFKCHITTDCLILAWLSHMSTSPISANLAHALGNLGQTKMHWHTKQQISPYILPSQ